MSRENVELVRAMCAAYARRDWNAAAEPLHSEIEWDTTGYPLPEFAHVFRGRGGVLDFFRRFLGTWDDYEAEFERFVDAGDDVVVFVIDRGSGKGSGARVGRSWAQIWTVRDGKVVRFRAYADRDEALRAVGARESA